MQVHKSATILQQLAALCSFCERTTWKALLNWSSLCGWLQSTVKSLSSEYLKQGEAEIIIPLWLKVLEDAGSDYLHSRTGDNIRNRQEYMQGKGGRTLKRIIRDFAESHRNAPTSCPSWCADGTEFISLMVEDVICVDLRVWHLYANI